VSAGNPDFANIILLGESVQLPDPQTAVVWARVGILVIITQLRYGTFLMRAARSYRASPTAGAAHNWKNLFL
jgi:hypothetical protein